MRVVTVTTPPAKTLLEIIIKTYQKSQNINEVVREANRWQKERMKAEYELFGSTLTREITQDEARSAIHYLFKRGILK